MNMNNGLRVLASAGLIAALGGCMSPSSENDRQRELNQHRIEFVNATTQAALVAANATPGAPAVNVDAGRIRAMGCPLLADFVEDMSAHESTPDNLFPASAKEVFGCFGIKGDGTLDDIDVIANKLNNPAELLDCICGGDGLRRLLGGNYAAFSASASRAVDAYDAAQSKTVDKFNASGSKAVDRFDASKSSGM